MHSSPQNSAIILVHGAWADGSCWTSVILPLKRCGFDVICAPLPLTSLTDDIAALQRVLARTQGPVLLAAHAYGGAVIGAASDRRVKSLVFIAALAPDAGETVAQVFYREKPHADAPALAPDDSGFIWLPEEGFRRAVAHRASPAQTSLMAAIQRPIAVQCIQQPAPAPAWKTTPSWYLLAEEDRMIHPRTQRFMADRMRAKVLSKPVDHSPMLTAPDIVIDLILEASAETLSR